MGRDKKYSKKRARTAEFHRQQVEQEVAMRVDEILSNIAKRKAKAEKEKNHPVPHGSVTVCDNIIKGEESK